MESTSFIKFSLISLLWITVLMNEMHGYKACLETERTALLEIKSFFISVSDVGYDDEILPSWVRDDGGISSNCCDDWEGVKCHATTRRVMQLSLNETTKFNYYSDNSLYYGVSLLNMSLFLPFDELRSLDLSGNWFEGIYENKAYDSFGNLKQLKILNLDNNRFNDSILPYLNTLTSLTTLILSWNRIEGSRTNHGLTNLRHLQVLDLSWNHNITSGSLTRLGLINLTNLKTLDLSHCGITTLQGLAKLKNLEALDLSYNNINGLLESQGIRELKNLFELNLKGNNIESPLPDCLKDMSHLKALDISYNQLSGNLPSFITNLTSLEYLALSGNKFEGTFPFSLLANHSKLEVLLLSPRTNMLRVKTEIFLPTFQLKALTLINCKLKVIPSFLLYQYDLKLLDLSHNNLVGDFPTWVLQNNTNLEVLILRNNSFTGNLQLPNSKHDFLHHLDASINNFTGKLPQDMGIILQKLLYIDMSNNRFEGNLPSSIGEMKDLRFLQLSENNFSGELSAPLLTGCISLLLLDLSNNNFYGQIFPKYMTLTWLYFLYLENNNFSGKIEEGLLNSTGLQDLDISNNSLSGHIPHWIGNFSYLEVLSMSKNFLEGNIPVQLLNPGSLHLLSVSENCLSGSMTSSFNHSSLEHLYLQKNSLSGPIPNALFRSSKLMTLDLRDNKFSGIIPHQINESSNIRFLLLRENYLEGQISSQLCQLRRLGVLDLSHNKINGSIPSCFTNMLLWRAGYIDLNDFQFQSTFGLRVSSIGTYYNSILNLEQYKNRGYTIFHQLVKVEFVTKNRYEIYKGSIIKYMVGLDLSCNQLTGDIPSEIGELQNIHGLNLSHNSLSGSIPGSFSNLKMIESLDISYNRLRGQIPPQLIELNFLSNFNVSYNNLSGLIPDKDQFTGFDESSYRGNHHLCGPAINKSCNSTEKIPATTSIRGEDEDECAIDVVSLYWSFGASYVTVILGLFAILWINSNWRRQWFYFIDA